MKALEFIGHVEGGRLQPQLVADTFRRHFRSMEGKRVCVSLKEVKRQRSGNQNRYYWGVVVSMVHEMFRDAGNEVDEEQVHEFLKEHVGHLETVIVDPSGKRRRVTGSTAKLSTSAFEDYLEKIRAWAAGFDVQIPLPNETAFDYGAKDVGA